MTPDNLLMMSRIQWGEDVCDSVHEKVGTVVKVYRATPYGMPPPRAVPTVQEPYLEVDHDGTHLFIPSGSISDVTDDCVVLNITREHIDEMGWQDRPDFLQDEQV